MLGTGGLCLTPACGASRWCRRWRAVSFGGHAPVAQWTRASVFGTECRGFESPRARQLAILAPQASCALLLPNLRWPCQRSRDLHGRRPRVMWRGRGTRLAEETETSMRVAVVACGSRGDVQPMLALAVGLRAAGHDALFCSSPDNAAWARSLGCTFEAIGEPLRGNPALGGWGLRPFNRFIRRQLYLQVRDLPRVVKDCDLIVASGLVWASARWPSISGSRIGTSRSRRPVCSYDPRSSRHPPRARNRGPLRRRRLRAGAEPGTRPARPPARPPCDGTADGTSDDRGHRSGAHRASGRRTASGETDGLPAADTAS